MLDRREPNKLIVMDHEDKNCLEHIGDLFCRALQTYLYTAVTDGCDFHLTA